MRIEHIAMYVNDLEIAREFFVKYFNATSSQMAIELFCKMKQKLKEK